MTSLMQQKLKRAALEKKKRKSLIAFFGELKEELKKVTWTTKGELITATKIVVGAVFAIGLGVYVIDLLIKGALEVIKFPPKPSKALMGYGLPVRIAR